MIKNNSLSIEEKSSIMQADYSSEFPHNFQHWKSPYALNGQTYREYLKKLPTFEEKLIFEMHSFSRGVIYDMLNFPQDDRFMRIHLESTSYDPSMKQLYEAFYHLGFKDDDLKTCCEIAKKHCLWYIGKNLKHSTTGMSNDYNLYFQDKVEDEFRKLFGDAEYKLGYQHASLEKINRSNNSMHKPSIFKAQDININQLSDLLHIYTERIGLLSLAIDGGAGFGEISKQVASYLDVNGKILSVEPFPGNWRFLEDLSRYDKRIIHYPYALSNNNKDRYFYNPRTVKSDSTWGKRGLTGYSSIGRLLSEQESSNININNIKNNEIFFSKIKCITIDKIMHENNYSGIDFVKLDLQGGEYDALLGASKHINHTNIVWFETINDLRPLFLFSKLGFTLFDTLYVFPEKSENIPYFTDYFEVIYKTISSLDTKRIKAKRNFIWNDIKSEWVQIQKKFGMIQTDFIAFNKNIINYFL